jgi:hypothetical protein
VNHDGFQRAALNNSAAPTSGSVAVIDAGLSARAQSF